MSWRFNLKCTENKKQRSCGLGNAEFTLYTFAVSNGLDKWDVSKRYSDFVKLHAKLTAKHGKSELPPPPPLPPKQVFGVLSPMLIRERHAAFKMFLTGLATEDALIADPDVMQFLRPEPGTVLPYVGLPGESSFADSRIHGSV